MIWIEVQKLRKSGRFQEAIDLGLKELDKNAGDFKLRNQIRNQTGWAFYDLIKNQVSLFKNETKEFIHKSIANDIHQALRSYAKLPKCRPDNILSNIIRELSKIAEHLDFFPKLIRWIEFDTLSTEDWQYSHSNDKKFPPIAYGIARSLTKWVKKNRDANPKDIELALEWIDRTIPTTTGDDVLWLNWDKVYLLQRAHRHTEAAKILISVIKAKRNEYWVWHEAAKLYATEQPELAIACFCRALECPSKREYTVKVHRDLAKILVQQGNFIQASSELNIEVKIRNDQGWKIDDDLQGLLNCDWYDSSAQGAEQPDIFYSRYSQKALILCFDFVESKPATYLGRIVLQQQKDAVPRRKTQLISRFAIRDSKGESVSIISSTIRCNNIKIGAPVTLVIGKQEENNQDAIIQVTNRLDGIDWDCTDTGTGLIIREVTDNNKAKVFINRNLEIAINNEAWLGINPPKLGNGVSFQTSKNLKTGKKEIFAVNPSSRPNTDIKEITGQLKRNTKGYAFIDDVFVPPFLLEKIQPEVLTVNTIAICTKDPKKDKFGWKAIIVTPA